jgi:outer membrane protein OmpA-like peptidoglycan-associated protein
LHVSRLAGALAVGLLCGHGGIRDAYAQEVGYQLNRYEPTPAGDPFSVVEYPWYKSTRFLAAGLTFDYARNLLVASTGSAPIANSQGAHLDGAISMWDRAALTLSVPFVLTQSGEQFGDVGPSSTTLGDPRLGARVLLYGETDALLTVSGSAYLWIPVGAEDELAGDNGVRGMGRVTAGGLWNDSIRWAVNGSLLLRETAKLSDTSSPAGNTVGSELQLSAAAGFLAFDRRVSVGPELITSFAIAGGLPDGQRIVNAEAFATAHIAMTDELVLGAGIGGSLAGEPGPPDARVLFSLAYAPVPKRGSSFERVIVLPDEDGHIGGVVVDDGKTKTVLDKAYASTEIKRKDKVARAVTSSPQAAQGAATLARTLPASDRDRDGIADAEDGCPDRAGVASADPVRHGCPTAAEKIVVLPDADGHVGGVEVDDGKTKTLVDTAYGSVEVSSDGFARAVPPATPKAVSRTVAVIATALPPPDADEDGVLDRDDACPDRAGTKSRDPIRHGCPIAAERIVVVPDADGHVGGVEVDDGKTKTLIDQPFAAVEVGGDGTARLVPPVAPRNIERAIATIAATLPIADGDGDGIRYEDDACPDRAGAASADPVRHGCPATLERVVVIPDDDGHVGAVEVTAGKTKLLLDGAFATSEVTATGVKVAPRASVTAVVKASQALAKSLPMQDRDEDNVADRDDACPDRKGMPSSDATRSGCPPTAERVVVLADENGTVGAVEVEAGTTKTLLDKAYASAEVGVDGLARAMPAEASDVSARFAAAMAAQPPGARIILYFTVRSQPVRDLTGPIDNLVAEVKARQSYTIEVIGHTDQTGSERANVRIGNERAQVIADRLIAAGVPADRITIKSMGSREPAVKLKSRKIVELRNRRVEIWVR